MFHTLRVLPLLLSASPVCAQFTVDNGTLLGFDATTRELVEYTPGGAVVETLVVSTPGIPVGVTTVNGEVWTIDTSEQLGRVNLSTGQLESVFTPAITTAEALGSAAGELLVANYTAAEILRYDTAGNQLGTIPLSLTVSATAIDGDGTRLFLGEYTTGAIHEFDMSGVLQATFNFGIAPSNLSGLAHDPATDTLWVSTGFGSDLLYNVNLSGNVLATYPAQSPWINGLDYVGGATIGATYCTPAVPNSTGSPGVIAAYGSDVASIGSLTLVASSLPSGEFAFFLGGLVQGFVPNAGGSQGNYCLGIPVARFNAQLGQVANGSFSIAVDTASVPLPPSFAHTITAGETWSFQCWYRDQNPGSTSNFTDAVEVLFL